MPSETAPSVWSIGLMSGTSLDGIDAALLLTDGETVREFGPSVMLHYDDAFRAALRGLISGEGDVLAIEHELTLRHADAVKQLLTYAEMDAGQVEVVGFHGQTIVHRPDEGMTWQIGNGSLLAAQCGINVVCDFRRHDVAAGGQGAPLVPLFHAALAHDLPKPAAVLNIGGVANVTWIGSDGSLLAFDTGPGNALINDWVHRHTGAAYDEDGKLAANGRIDQAFVQKAVAHPFFSAPPPKSLDRNTFISLLDIKASAEDGAATLTAFTAESVAQALRWLPEVPLNWYVCGGGGHNATLMGELRKRLNAAVHSVDTLGWQGDVLEAQAFAFLAVRSLRGLPLSLPSTTGVSRAVTGGAFYQA